MEKQEDIIMNGILEDTTVFEKIKNNESESYDLCFNTFNDKTLETIDSILKWQSDNLSEAIKYNISIKNMTKEEKIKVLKHIIKNENVVDSYIILNLFNFIKGFNTFDVSFFESKEVYVNDMEEYLDIKYALKDELKELMKKISLYYLSIIRSCHEVNNTSVYMVVIPLIIQRLLYICDFYTLSAILSKTKDINIDDTFIVNNALSFINVWSENQIINKKIMSYIDNMLNITENIKE